MSIQRDVEALLFSSGRALTVDALSSILDCDPKEIKKSLSALKKEYEERETAIKIYDEADSWKMLVRDEHIPVVQRVVADTEFGRSTLETLAVVAYGNPILQSDVIEKRGSHAYEHIKELEKAGFITKKPEGRSYTLKLAEKFFEYFDVEGQEDIRAVFADVKVPEPPKETQEHLGDLAVVDVSKESDNPFMDRELGTRPEMTPEERAEQSKFLDEIDKKLRASSEKNNGHEADPLLTRGVPDESAQEEFSDAASTQEESSELPDLDLEKL